MIPFLYAYCLELREFFNDMLNGEPLPTLTDLSMNFGYTIPIIFLILGFIAFYTKLNKYFEHLIFTLLILEVLILTINNIVHILPYLMAHKSM